MYSIKELEIHFCCFTPSIQKCEKKETIIPFQLMFALIFLSMTSNILNLDLFLAHHELNHYTTKMSGNKKNILKEKENPFI